MKNTVKTFIHILIDGLKPFNKKNISTHITLISIPVLVLLFLNFSVSGMFRAFFGNTQFVQGLNPNQFTFWAQAYMSACTFFFFMIVPIIVFKLLPIKMDYAYGMRITGIRRHFVVSILIVAFMVPILWISFATSGFNNFYPMYKPLTLKDWFFYECIYLPLFLPTEFFFRGVVLYRLESFFPGRGVWVAIIAYAIGHLFKPLPEAMASIIAGYVLGMLSLHSRSIWPGFIVHVSIAFLADLFAMIHSGYMQRLLSI
ncbi:MAG: CPBP family intramembrane metalloprotease [Spirochaetia bacterium]|nr:CPBP family intramembrane metalloprotease [Spirochaetia bacterium]